MSDAVRQFVNARSSARKIFLHEELKQGQRPVFQVSPNSVAVYYDEDYKVFCDLKESDVLFIPLYPAEYNSRMEARQTEEIKLVNLLRYPCARISDQTISVSHIYSLEVLTEAFRRLQVAGCSAASLLLNPLQFDQFSKIMKDFFKSNSLRDTIQSGSFGTLWDAQVYLSHACSARELFVVGESFSTGMVVTHNDLIGMAMFDTSSVVRVEGQSVHTA